MKYFLWSGRQGCEIAFYSYTFKKLLVGKEKGIGWAQGWLIYHFSLSGVEQILLWRAEHAKSLQSCPTPKEEEPMRAPPYIGFSRQEHWSGLPFPSPRNLPDPGIELTSPALALGVHTPIFPKQYHELWLHQYTGIALLWFHEISQMGHLILYNCLCFLVQLLIRCS